MAIDRGPWNALVDDDGSNLVGSVWDKAAIKNVILDPVDAAMGMQLAAFTPTLVNATGAEAAYTNRSGVYQKVGRFVFAQVYLLVAPGAIAGTAALRVGGLPFPSQDSPNYGTVTIGYWGPLATPVVWLSGSVPRNVNYCSMYKMTAAATGPTTLTGQDLVPGLSEFMLGMFYISAV